MLQNSAHNPLSLRCVLLFQVSNAFPGVCSDEVLFSKTDSLRNLNFYPNSTDSIQSQLCTEGRLFFLDFVELG